MDCAPSVTVFGQLMLRLLDSSGNEYLLVQIFHGQQNHSLGVYVMQSAVMSILQWNVSWLSNFLIIAYARLSYYQ